VLTVSSREPGCILAVIKVISTVQSPPKQVQVCTCNCGRDGFLSSRVYCFHNTVEIKLNSSCLRAKPVRPGSRKGAYMATYRDSAEIQHILCGVKLQIRFSNSTMSGVQKSGVAFMVLSNVYYIKKQCS